MTGCAQPGQRTGAGLVAPAPVALALDAADLDQALAWATAAGPWVSTVKVGLELFLRYGAAGVQSARQASGGRAVFLDLKLADIPNTVSGAARAVAGLAPEYLTVHALGGAPMIAAAAEALPDTLITAVTVLTSLDAAALAAMGIAGPPDAAVRRLATLAVAAGARALVCSPREVAAVRAEVGPGIVLVTPGVRPAGTDPGDQSRTATPEQAIADGADLLVVGRPVTRSPDVAQAARALARSLAALPRRASTR